MEIKETSIFTKRLFDCLDEEAYRLLQLYLIDFPTAGPVIRGTGGLRKIRWAERGRGKRGGVRVIYYHAKEKSILLMLLIYSKSEMDDLSPDQKAILKGIVEEEFS